MNKKIERLITAGMIAALVVVFFYQVAYAPQSLLSQRKYLTLDSS
jgi:hypothetical protein